ncbi:MAG: cupin domain-containing protein [Steroidobacteraceae bacterium]
MSEPSVRFAEIKEITAQRLQRAEDYFEFLRVPAISAGLYVLAAGSLDRQTPHGQDELYYVLRGKARLRAGAEDRSVREGSVVFVAARLEHQFYDIEEELSVLVVFAPAERE